MKHDQSATPGPSGVSRRTVVKGAAWAVPAIAVASSVPAMAASGDVFQITGVTVACKFSDLKHYHLEVTIENTGNVADTIESIVITGENSSGQNIVWPVVADKCMCPGDKWVLVVNSVNQGGGNIASFGATISWQGQTPVTLATASDTTPDCNSQKPPFESYDTVNTYWWLPLYTTNCAGCP